MGQLAYNLGNFLRRFALPGEVSHWSLRGVQLKLIKIGARIINHAHRTVFQMAEMLSVYTYHYKIEVEMSGR